MGFFPRSHSYQPQPPPEQGEEGAGLWEYLYFWRYGMSVSEFVLTTSTPPGGLARMGEIPELCFHIGVDVDVFVAWR